MRRCLRENNKRTKTRSERSKKETQRRKSNTRHAIRFLFIRFLFSLLLGYDTHPLFYLLLGVLSLVPCRLLWSTQIIITITSPRSPTHPFLFGLSFYLSPNPSHHLLVVQVYSSDKSYFSNMQNPTSVLSQLSPLIHPVVSSISSTENNICSAGS